MRRVRPFAGMTAAFVLVLISLIAVLAFSSAGLSVHHLSFARHQLSTSQASCAAESVLALGVEKLLADPTWGKDPATKPLIWTGPEGARASLSFQTGSAPHSTNNLESDTACAGWSECVVPEDSAHLVALGSCRGIERRIELVIHLPPFPYAVACSGRFESAGDLLIGSLPAGMSLEEALAEDKLAPSHLAANASGSDALALGPGTEIRGDVRSAGEVSYDPTQTHIAGEVVRYGEPVRLPTIELADYDPLLQGRQGVQTFKGLVSEPVLEGWARSSGNLNVVGGLTLDGGVLFVDGDLNVQGGVKGTGALIVTGKTTLSGGANLASDNRVCLLSGGRIAVRGAGENSSYFNGLMYTREGLEASDATLVGTFVCNSSDCNSVVRIERATVVEDPSAARMTVVEGEPAFGLRSVTADGHVAEIYPVRYPELWDQVSQSGGGVINFGNLMSFLQSQRQSQSQSLNSGGSFSLKALGPRPKIKPTFSLLDPNGCVLESGDDLFSIFSALSKRRLSAPDWTLYPLPPEQLEEVYGSATPTFEFDLNRFLPMEDNLKVLLCRPLPADP